MFWYGVLGMFMKLERRNCVLSILFSLVLYAIQIILPFIAFIIVYNCFKSIMFNCRYTQPLIVLYNRNTKKKIPVMYWENSIGRSKSSDIVIDGLTVSRNHAVLFRRKDGWFVSDTNSKLGVTVNGIKAEERMLVSVDDVINMGGVELVLKKASETIPQKKMNKKYTYKNKFHKDKISSSSESILFLITAFHFLASFTGCFSKGSFNIEPAIAFCGVTTISWIYFILTKYGFKRVGFELECVGIFLSGIGIITISSVNIKQTYNQIIAMALGTALFCIMLNFLKNPDRAMKFRPYVAIFAIILFILNIVFGKIKNGSQNWLSFGEMTFQPSELIKIAFVFVGASTLERLQTAKNLTGFILFSTFCLFSLFIMGDFGTACIFFITFLIIAFMRSGSIRTIILICSSAVLGGLMILKFRPYIIDRFSVWRNIWDHMNDLGFQQTRVLTYSASGGLFGVGIGKGCLKYIFASNTDLIFGMICEEWGFILAIITVLCIALIAVYARKASIKSRSVFYSIASCSAAGLLMFQTSLNVFGATDILPLTGVTLPFVSLGGSSMICVWGLLAFIKASDECTYAVRG